MSPLHLVLRISLVTGDADRLFTFIGISTSMRSWDFDLNEFSSFSSFLEGWGGPVVVVVFGYFMGISHLGLRLLRC